MNGHPHQVKDIPSSLTKHQEGIIAAKRPRSSNLELYRIICMLMIVAHHYVVNSGLTSTIVDNPTSSNSIFLLIFGAWGKTGINCFLMITGYFMCTSTITIRKFLKLLLQVYFYKLLLFPIFLVAGYETVSLERLVRLAMPVWGISDGFVGCFLLFFLTIPFWNILIKNMGKRQHQLLMLLLLVSYTLLGSIPSFNVTFNYVTWFGIIYLISSYIRLYPNRITERRGYWGWITLACVMLTAGSILVKQFILTPGSTIVEIHYFVYDCNKIFAVLIAVCSFLWFKNISMPYSKVINTIGATTFGVFLIHANSNAMRIWLWKDTVDVVGHYALPIVQLVLYSIVVVLAIFSLCSLIDYCRAQILEKQFFKWYDKNLDSKFRSLIKAE